MHGGYGEVISTWEKGHGKGVYPRGFNSRWRACTGACRTLETEIIGGVGGVRGEDTGCRCARDSSEQEEEPWRWEGDMGGVEEDCTSTGRVRMRTKVWWTL